MDPIARILAEKRIQLATAMPSANFAAPPLPRTLPPPQAGSASPPRPNGCSSGRARVGREGPSLPLPDLSAEEAEGELEGVGANPNEKTIDRLKNIQNTIDNLIRELSGSPASEHSLPRTMTGRVVGGIFVAADGTRHCLPESFIRRHAAHRDIAVTLTMTQNGVRIFRT